MVTGRSTSVFFPATTACISASLPAVVSSQEKGREDMSRPGSPYFTFSISIIRGNEEIFSSKSLIAGNKGLTIGSFLLIILSSSFGGNTIRSLLQSDDILMKV